MHLQTPTRRVVTTTTRRQYGNNTTISTAGGSVGGGGIMYDDGMHSSQTEDYNDATTTTATTIDKYGYGDATPDVATSTAAVDESNNKYGYEDAYPDSTSASSADNSSDKYGYGDATPDRHRHRTVHHRRSSLKSSNDSCPHARRRRASIQCGENHPCSHEIEIELPGRRFVRRRSSIQFNESVQVKSVIPTKDIKFNGKATDVSKLWFQDEEYDVIKERSLMLVEYVEQQQGELSNNNKLVATTASSGKKVPCVRGLEGYIGDGEIVKQDRKDDAWDTVLYEQYNQRLDGIYYDDDKMSQQYKLCSHGSKMDAIQRAKQDEIAIEKYTRSTRRKFAACRRLSC